MSDLLQITSNPYITGFESGADKNKLLSHLHTDIFCIVEDVLHSIENIFRFVENRYGNYPSLDSHSSIKFLPELDECVTEFGDCIIHQRNWIPSYSLYYGGTNVTIRQYCLTGDKAH